MLERNQAKFLANDGAKVVPLNSQSTQIINSYSDSVAPINFSSQNTRKSKKKDLLNMLQYREWEQELKRKKRFGNARNVSRRNNPTTDT